MNFVDSLLGKKEKNIGRIFGGRGWDDLPIKFVDVLKSRLSEHHFKVLESLTSKHDILSSKFFQDPQFLVSAPDVAIKALSYLLVRLGNQLAQRDWLIDAENACLLSLKLNPNNDNPAHFSLAFIYTIENRLEEAKQEANLALQHLYDLDAKALEFSHELADDTKFLFGWSTMVIIFQNRLQDMISFVDSGGSDISILFERSDIAKLFEYANFTVVLMSVMSDPDLKKHLTSFT